MTESPKVTVIVPFYKVQKYFERCLNSIVSQTIKELEIILIDDCGGDRSIEIAQEFAQRDSRIKIIQNEKNKGQGYSRNVGTRLAKGEYVAFVDSDDWLEPEMYELLYKKAVQTDADIVKCGFRFVWKDSTSIYDIKYIFPDEEKTYKAVDNPLKILGEQITAVWSGFYKKEFLLKYNFNFDEINKFEDLLFCWQTMIKANRIAVVGKVLCNYNKTNSTSDTNISKFVVKYIAKDLELLGGEIKENKALHSSYILHVYNNLLWVLPKVNLFQKKDIFNKYHQFLKGIDKTGVEELVLKNLAAPKIRYYINGNYNLFCKKNFFIADTFKKVKRSFAYAGW